MLIVSRQLSQCDRQPDWQLWLTAEERARSRYRYDREEMPPVLLQLPRGTRLVPNHFLVADSGEILQILAAPETVIEVTSPEPLTLLRVAYHLGNRHVPLEVTENYLKLLPDPVLETLIQSLGAKTERVTRPFFPEAGAFHSHS